MDSESWYIGWLLSVLLVTLALMLVLDHDSAAEEEEMER